MSTSTAKQIAYSSGVRQLEGVVLRIEALEAKIVEQQTTIAALQSTVLALKHQKDSAV